ncbi:MAG TPA: ECF transporter S component [Galbitalea sp.]|jgi:energy-coupling factor transport system substrate-specific component|nr:ECF transporter S component [Galbitalea sp.]
MSAVSTPKRSINFTWRVVDIVIAAVLAVACGVAFWAWDTGSVVPTTLLSAVLPGLQGILGGVWLLAAVLVPLVVRKPGAAILAEIVAATVETLLGTAWGPDQLLYGLIQGLGAEIVFAAFLYSSWRLGTAMLAGAGAGVGLTVLDLVLYYRGQTLAFDLIYGVSSLVSGALIAGLVSWLLVRAVAKTGALSRFASGRTSRQLI